MKSFMTRTAIGLVCAVCMALSLMDHHFLGGMLNDASFGLLMGAWIAGTIWGNNG